MQPHDRATAEGILLTDQYQLSMAQLYFREGLHTRPAQFDYFFRSYPDYGMHQAGYAVTAGLEWLLDWMEQSSFDASVIELLRSKTTSTGKPFYDETFLEWLSEHGDLGSIVMRAVPEGRVVHANAPVAVVEGPLIMGQILETSLLNHLNYPTLIATKASRMVGAARGGPVLEFGVRRGPGSGSNAGARAAMIGGAAFTSNVGISQVLGYDPKGTHAHSMVQAYMAVGAGELEAFRAFARSYPDDCVLLVDTIDTLDSGVPNAITVFKELRVAGHEPIGIRLDSGDLAYLAIRSARELNRAGFDQCQIVLSSNLDELAIWQILSQIDAEASRYGVDPKALIARLVYGVGTRLITSAGHAALDGVYKLAAIENDGEWAPAIKVSENPEKVPTPGDKRVWRVYDNRGLATADVITQSDEDPAASTSMQLFHPHRPGSHRTLRQADISGLEPLHADVLAKGERLAGRPSIDEMRARRQADLDRLDPGVRRLINPHVYHVSLSAKTKALQSELVTRARETARDVADPQLSEP
ncbi:MAG: nicotinate phosphoribosyltransferase [Acidimicrobiia bacterium]|nr:nicotinate phosphoribosyltransferase [Acidimicrobiia bacterium]